MSQKKRCPIPKLALSLLAFGLTLAILALAPELPSPLATAQAEAAAWVEGHRASLPKSLDELSTHPMTYRRAIIAELSTEDQGRLWRVHLESFVLPDDASRWSV